jgi:hypothetical protein
METGRPPFYSTPEEFEAKVVEYFANPPMKAVRAGNDMIEIPVPTITGLALHLGFESRQSFYDYELKAGFAYTVKKARTLIERHYEEIMQSGNNAGAIFALKNFGWRDRVETDVTTNGKDVGVPLVRFIEP